MTSQDSPFGRLLGWLFALTLALPVPRGIAGVPVHRLAVPSLSPPPIIDGVIAAGEWDGAAAVTGFRTTFGNYLALQPVVRIGYDATNLYVCFQSPLTPDRRLPRRTLRDSEVHQDDSFELWLNPNFGTRAGMFSGYYQMVGNALGTILDVLYKPGIGQTYVGWNGDWRFRNSVTHGLWTAEIAIAFTELGADPPRKGTRWNANFCRDFPGWYQFTTWSAATSFSDISTMADLVFDPDAPAVQVLGLGDLGAGKLNLHVEIPATTTTVQATARVLDKDGNALLDVARPMTRDARGRGLVELEGTFKSGPGGVLHVQITGTDGTVYHSFTAPTEAAAQAVDVKEKPATVYAGYFPYTGWVKARIELGAKLTPEQVGEVALRLLAGDGRELVKAQAGAFVGSVASARAQAGDLAEGEYRIEVTLKGKDSATLYTETQPYVRRKFPWEHNTLGLSNAVVPPFTPIVVEGSTCQILLRKYAFGASGLPAQITSAGEDLLARPATWVVSLGANELTAEATGSVQVVKRDAAAAAWQGTVRLGDLEIATDNTLEYDGFVRVEVTLRPLKPVAVERLSLEFPVKADTAEFMTAWTCGYPRWNKAIPQTDDFDEPAWESKLMQQNKLRGTFTPLVWLGNDARGLYWVADSDEGWMLDDARSSQDIVRRHKRVVYRAHLVNTPTKLAAPRRLVFAYMATPVKPFPDGWRRWFAPAGSALEGPDSFRGVGGSWPSMPGVYGFGTVAPEWTRRWLDGLRKSPHSRVAVYMSVGNMPLSQPELACFRAEWVGLRPPGLEFNEPYLGRKPEEYPYITNLTREAVTGVNVDLPRSAVDCRVWYWKELVEKARLNGGYWDGPIIYPTGADPETGAVYERDDGTLQPTYRFFSARELHKRIITLQHELDVPPFHIAHSTGGVALPSIAFMQVILGAEDPGMQGEKSPDLLDLWPPDRYRTEMGKQWGMPVWMLIPTHTEPDVGHGCDPAPTRSGIALCLLHDTLPAVAYGNPSVDLRVAAVKAEFGIAEPDATFTPYWEGVVTSSDTNVVTSVYRRPGAALVVPVNRGPTGAYQTLELSRLGLGAVSAAQDGETGENLLPCIKGSAMTFFVGRHDYRMVRLTCAK